jgi:hypothetical protein
MVVIKFATYTNRCPFSKNIIHPTNKICLFNLEQFEAFKKIINKVLPTLLPEELIDLIIEKTGYEKLIHSFGLINYTYWTEKLPLSNKIIKKNKNKTDLIIEFAKLTGFSDEETEETDISSDEESVSQETEETDSE